MENNPPREEPATTAEVSLPFGNGFLTMRIGAARVEVGGKEVTFAPEEFVEIKEMLEWWRRVRSPVSFQPSVESLAPSGPTKKVWLQFDDGTKSQEAIRAMWITDADGQMHKMDADTMTKLVEMVEWYKRVHEAPVATSTLSE